MRTLLVSFLRIAIVVFVLFEIIGITSIDWFVFHPEMVRETYDAATERMTVTCRSLRVPSCVVWHSPLTMMCGLSP